MGKKKRPKNFECTLPKCGKTFVSSRALGDHMNVHSGARPYVCDYPGCGKGFKQQNHSDQHFRAKHTNDRPHECDFPGCDKAFANSSHLGKHKRTHTSEKPFVCDFKECGKTFNQSSELITHKRSHTGERPYVCRKKDCSKTFAQSGHRVTHEKSCGTVSNFEPKVEPQIMAFLLKSVEWPLLKTVLQFLFDLGYDMQDIEIFMGRSKFKTTLMLPDNTQYRPDLMVACPGWGTLWLEIDEMHHHPSQYDPEADFTRMRRTWLEYLLPRGLGPVHVVRFRTTNGTKLEPEEGLMELRRQLQLVIGCMQYECNKLSPHNADLNIHYVNSPPGVQEPPNVREAMQHDSETFAFKDRQVKCRVWW